MSAPSGVSSLELALRPLLPSAARTALAGTAATWSTAPATASVPADAVIGGLVGSGDRVGYTVHGDNVNLTARLEQLNKDYGTRIIVADSTRRQVAEGEFDFRELGEVAVRGLNRPVRIFTVVPAPA